MESSNKATKATKSKKMIDVALWLTFHSLIPMILRYSNQRRYFALLHYFSNFDD